MKLPKVLITQAANPTLRAMYAKLTEQYNAEVDFRAFTKVDYIPLPLFRTYKPTIRNYSAFLFTNKIAIDGFFQFAKICNIQFPASTKYFLATEQLQNYLQKYIEIKKRKVFHGTKQIEDLFPSISKHKKERFLLPCSDIGRKTLRDFFEKKRYRYTEMVLYKNQYCSLEDLDPARYDIIVFFSPLAVQAFDKRFPGYSFEKTKIAAFSEKTIQALQNLGYPVTIQAPTPEAPSMLNGLNNYLQKMYDESVQHLEEKEHRSEEAIAPQPKVHLS